MAYSRSSTTNQIRKRTKMRRFHLLRFHEDFSLEATITGCSADVVQSGNGYFVRFPNSGSHMHSVGSSLTHLRGVDPVQKSSKFPDYFSNCWHENSMRIQITSLKLRGFFTIEHLPSSYLMRMKLMHKLFNYDRISKSSQERKMRWKSSNGSNDRK